MASLEEELRDAYGRRRPIEVPPSARGGTFDLTTAYAVDNVHAQRRRAEGHRTVGLKVGFANKAAWRVFKLETVVWGRMYDDTVHHATANEASLPVASMCAPKIEPEIMFRLRTTPGPGLEPAEVLQHVEWMALGFEIIDCAYAGWKFQPADFVASFGFHAGLIVGEPRTVTSEAIPSLVDRLGAFTVRLLKDGQVAAEGSGRNVLRSPALCLAELASAVAAQPGADPLVAGDIVSSGTLTDSQFIAPHETWAAVVDGIELPGITLHTT